MRLVERAAARRGSARRVRAAAAGAGDCGADFRGSAAMSSAAPAAEPLAAPPMPLGRVRWTGFKTIVIREFSRIVRIWGQTIVPPAVTATLYFVIFGSLIGRRVGPMGGFDYMQYIAPGLIMMAVITNSYGNVVSLVLRRQVRQARRGAAGVAAPELADRVRLRRRRHAARAAGGSGGDDGVAPVHRICTCSTCAVILAAVLLTTLGLRARRLHQCAVRQELRPDELDPDFRADAAHLFRRRVLLDRAAAATGRSGCRHVNPILYMVNAFRYGFLGVSDVDVAVAFALMSLAAAVLFAVAVTLMDRGTGIRD